MLREQEFARHGLTREAIAEFLHSVQSAARRVSPASTLPLQVRDPKDEKVLAAALGGKAKYLVTGDQNLLVLKDDPRLGGLQIATVRGFLDLLRQA